jgi:hypothetical protein
MIIKTAPYIDTYKEETGDRSKQEKQKQKKIITWSNPYGLRGNNDGVKPQQLPVAMAYD